MRWCFVDGKRRHRGAVLRLGSFGPHGVDIGGLPSIAFGGVEVLRDGAAAQYGSDAIAGVLDFKLRESASGFDVRVRRGGYSAGDGEETTVEATGGLPLGRGGFLTLSAQVAAAEATSRSEPYDLPIGGSGLTPLASTRNRLTVDGTTYYGPDALTYVYDASGNVVQVLPGSDGVPDDLDTRFADNYANVGGSSPFASPVQIWGQPRRRQAMLVANAGKPLGERAELYGFASYSRKDQRSGFFYRRPGVSQLLPVRLADGAIYDPRTSLYPSGFTPQFRGEVDDYAMHAGVRGDSARGLGYDFSATYGRSRVRYHLENTLNPSLGPGDADAVSPRQPRQRRTGAERGFHQAAGDWRTPAQLRLRGRVPQRRLCRGGRRPGFLRHRAVRAARSVQLGDHASGSGCERGRRAGRGRVPRSGVSRCRLALPRRRSGEQRAADWFQRFPWLSAGLRFGRRAAELRRLRRSGNGS